MAKSTRMATRRMAAAFDKLTEGCISAILSRTTPVEVCRLSLVSKTFLSAAESDTVWNRFLPSDSQLIDSIISESSFLTNAPTKKALYLALSDRPIIIDYHGLKSFQLDRKSGKICYMLAARSLTIDCCNDDSDSDSDGEIGIEKEWIPMHDSRFLEVAKICHVYSLEIRGMINTLVLSPNTQYVAYLVFKMIDAYGFDNEPMELSVGVEGGHSSNKSVCLDPNVKHIKPHNTKVIGHTHSARCKCYRGSWIPHSRVLGLQCPSVRSDGWLEIEMGEFFNSNLEDKQVQMSVIERSNLRKGNFFLEGIEVRLKEGN